MSCPREAGFASELRRRITARPRPADENAYERGIKITDAQLAAVNLTPDQFHGEWNYIIKPNT